MNSLNLGFIVEGDTDKIIVEILAQRLLSHLPIDFQFYTVRLGGKAALSSAYTTVWLFLDKGYEHVIILFDTDTIDTNEVSYQKLRLEKVLQENHIRPDEVTVCPVVPEIEAWLLSAYIESSEIFSDIKSKLQEVAHLKELTVENLGKLAQKIDLELVEQRNNSFAEFAQTLRTLVTKELQPA